MLDDLLYVALPYSAVSVAVAGTVVRLSRSRVGISALSSQFLEGQGLRWVSPSWHLGILGALLLHVVAFAWPDHWAQLTRSPAGLVVIETTGLVLGVLAAGGLVLAAVRRAAVPRVRAVTTGMDVLLLVVLGVQVFLGVGVAAFESWGAAWAPFTVVPYLRSLVTLSPDPALVTGLPWLVQAHIAGAWVLLALLPFSRLVHALFIPIAWLWRAPQVVISHRRGTRIGGPS